MKKNYVKAKSLQQQSYQVIKEAIIKGELKNHESLTEKKALELYGISRTPFREAIQRLSAEGWVVSIPYKGNYISPLTMADVEEILELRLIFETAMAKKVAKNITSEQIDILRNMIHELKEDPAIQSDYEFTLLDQAFHKTINGFGDNQRLMSLSDQIYDMMRRTSMTVLQSPIRRKEVISEHLALLNGLINNDVEQSIIHHYDRVRMESRKYFSSL